jgi:beta-galactosidase
MTRFVLVILAFGSFALHTFAAESRIVLPLAVGWKFFRGGETNASATNFDDGSWSKVTVPHTWNTDSDPPRKDYYRGSGWYRKSFVAEQSWKNKRVFVRFEAASLVARVFLNGKELGKHRGGFAAFCFELTPYLNFGGTNLLAVRVDNARHEDVIPLAGDFTVFGGLYRPVSLLLTDPINITPLDCGSTGVFIRQSNVSEKSAEVQIEAEVSNGKTNTQNVEVRISVLDANGAKVSSASEKNGIGGETVKTVTQKITIPRPHLWNGAADPYLYTVRVDLCEASKVVDTVEQPLGLRYFSFDARRGFLLNGRPQQIHGVNRHQDWAGTGWAISEAQQDADMKIMRDMGVTGVRLAHYQHNDYFYKLCDQNGLLVWTELPMVNDVRSSKAFLENTRQQLKELIRQNMNHPSIILWSLYNEINPMNKDNPVPIVDDLKHLAKVEDPGRPTTGAFSIDGIEKLPNVGRLNDVLALNVYPGWYLGVPEDMGAVIDKWNSIYGTNGIVISEYGAGANIHQHQQNFEGRAGRAPKDWHPEEWQAIVHEKNYAAIQDRPQVFGSYIWNMFDFASAARNEGDAPGINDKGLVTRDRQTKKDAYYFYQANWTSEPMVHITSSRDVERTTTNISAKIYSNCSKVTLRVNGKSCGEVEGDSLHIFHWQGIQLQPGENLIEAEAVTPSGVVRDVCRWVYQPKPI